MAKMSYLVPVIEGSQIQKYVAYASHDAHFFHPVARMNKPTRAAIFKAFTSLLHNF